MEGGLPLGVVCSLPRAFLPLFGLLAYALVRGILGTEDKAEVLPAVGGIASILIAFVALMMFVYSFGEASRPVLLLTRDRRKKGETSDALLELPQGL